jgi:hydrogenase/urease accessory protein HupE
MRIFASTLLLTAVALPAFAHPGHEPGALGAAHEVLHAFGGLDMLALMALVAVGLVTFRVTKCSKTRR